MKLKTHSARAGFSLIEILIVVAIIIGLATISFPVVNKMFKSGKIEENREMNVALERAIERFYDNYGYFPITISGDEQLDSSAIIDLLVELEGADDTPEFNTKGINFLEGFAEGKNGKGGIIRDSSSNIIDLKNTFGLEFNIQLDGDFDEILVADDNNEVRGKRALIWNSDDPANYDEGTSDPEYERSIITNW